MAKDNVKDSPSPWHPKLGFIGRLVLTLIGGTCLFLSFPNYDLWPLAYVALVPVLFVIEDRSPGRAFGWGLLSGLVTNLGGFHWIATLLKDFAEMSSLVAWSICALMCAYQGVLFGLWASLTRRLRLRWPGLPLWAITAPIFLALEFAMPLIFPWYLGNSQYLFYPVIQIADVLGVLGVSLTVLLVNLVLYEGLKTAWARATSTPRPIPWRFLGCAAAFVAFVLIYGVVRIGQIDEEMSAAKKLRVGMVEANIGIWEKRNIKMFKQNNLIHQYLSRKIEAEDVDLIVWPESSYQASAVFGSTAQTQDQLFLELDSIFNPAFRDGALPALRALEAGFGVGFHRDPRWRFWQILLFRIAGARGRKDPYYRAPPDEITFYMPGYEALSAIEAPRACQSRTDCEHNEICLENLNECASEALIGWNVYAVQRGFKTPLLFGGISLSRRDGSTAPQKDLMKGKHRQERDLYNIATLIDGVGRVVGSTKKVYLLVFGEYIPFGDRFPQLYDMIPQANDFSPGTEPGVIEFEGTRLGVMVCYEDILPRFVRSLAELRPQILFNVTNDAWFGKTSEPYLHLALAIFRSVETRTWLVRSTNTGVSAFVDANGRIVKQTSLEDAELIVEDVAIMSGDPTLYTRFGDILGWLALLAACGLLFSSGFMEKRRAKR